MRRARVEALGRRGRPCRVGKEECRQRLGGEEAGSEGKLVDIVVKECKAEQQLLERGSATSGSG